MRESYDYGLKTTISRIKDNFSRLTHKSLILISHSEERKFEIIGHLQQMIHDTHGFYSKIIDELWHLIIECLSVKITPKNAHLITLSDEKSGTMLFKVLKTVVETKAGQSGPLGFVSKTQGKCP